METREEIKTKINDLEKAMGNEINNFIDKNPDTPEYFLIPLFLFNTKKRRLYKKVKGIEMKYRRSIYDLYKIL